MHINYLNTRRYSNFKLSAVFTLILLTTIISIIAMVFWFVNPDSVKYFALQPDSIIRGNYLWTILLHMFVHGGILHLLVNMLVLFSLGSLCEKIIGRKRFTWLYILAGIFAGILSIVTSLLFGGGELAAVFGSPGEYMVGASGAIFAIAGLFVLILPKLKFTIIFLPFFSLPAYIMVPAVLIITWIVSIAAGWNIGNVAHFGGFIVGVLYGYYLRLRYRRKIEMLERYFR